jgi:hypothetical protein
VVNYYLIDILIGWGVTWLHLAGKLMAPRRLRHFTQEPSLVSPTALPHDKKSATDLPRRAKHSHVEELISSYENPLGRRPPALPCDNQLGRQPPDTPKGLPLSLQASSFPGNLSLPSPVTSELDCTNSLAPIALFEPQSVNPNTSQCLPATLLALFGLASRRPTTPAS